MSKDKVLTRKEVSEMTGIGISTILRITKSGVLPCFRATFPNGRTFYYEKDVLLFMENQKEKQAKLVENQKN